MPDLALAGPAASRHKYARSLIVDLGIALAKHEPMLGSSVHDMNEDRASIELVSACLGGGARTEIAERAARELLNAACGVGDLSRMDLAEIEALLRAAGFGRAARGARSLAAAFALGRAAAMSHARPAARFREARDVAAWAAPRLGGLVHEELWVLGLDSRGGLRAARCVARGGIHGVGVRVADPLRVAIRTGATGFALVHNHPSGDPTPSDEDVFFTRRVARAAHAADVPLVDHVVVTASSFASVPLEEGEVA